MNARFRIDAPKQVVVTLTLSATVDEWEKLRGALVGGHDLAGEFGLKLGKMIDDASRALSSERWTTGYAVGDVQEGA